MAHSQIFKLIECPRDAMQGLAHFVPTEVKVTYLNHLLRVGFDTLDFGSFVSPKVIPQLRDTAEVLAQLDLSATKTRLLAIVANLRGATEACRFDQIRYIGYPLSVSETFQQRNTNRSITEAIGEVSQIQNQCVGAGKTLVVYLSMGFGNPYGDAYSPEMVAGFTQKLAAMGIGIVAPSDTVGSATPAEISALFGALIPSFPSLEFGAHLHSTPQGVDEKVAAAYQAGVRRIDGALRGYGGCPMAKDELTGNLPTEQIVRWLEAQGIDFQINKTALADSLAYSTRVFSGES